MKFLSAVLLSMIVISTPARAFLVPNNVGSIYVYGDFAAYGGMVGGTFSYQTIGGGYSQYSTLEQITVRIDVNQTGYVVSNGCNLWEYHCGRGDRVNTSFSIWGPEDEGYISVSRYVTTTGGAIAPEVQIYISLWPGFTAEFAPRVAAVPEASTWAMMLLGFAGVAFMAYRQKRALQ